MVLICMSTIRKTSRKKGLSMYKDASDRLAEAGIKPSYQRLKILAYLMAQDGHPTAEQVHKDLIAEIPTLSKATVYNTLHIFTEKGLTRTLTSKKQGSRFDPLLYPHGHFICSACDEIFDFPCKELGLNAALEGFQVESEELVLRGLCKSCAGGGKR